MTQFAITPAWHLNDAGIEREAIEFWNRLNILPPAISRCGPARD